MPSAGTLITALALSLFLVLSASAHIEMTNLAPRNRKYIKGITMLTLLVLFVYRNLSPLGHTCPFPCQGKMKQRTNFATYQAGSSISVTLDGGHCQFALFYNNGNMFVVLTTAKRECLCAEGLSYTVPIPAGAPPGDAIFSWSWINAVSSCEYYQDCADVTIQGADGRSLMGPQLLVVNALPSTVMVPEFSSKQTAREDLLDAQPQITVRADQQGPGIFMGTGTSAFATEKLHSAAAPPTIRTLFCGYSPSGFFSSCLCLGQSHPCLPNISAQAFQMCPTNGWMNNTCPGYTICITSPQVVGKEIICGYLLVTSSARTTEGTLPTSTSPSDATENVPSTQSRVGGQILAAEAGCTPGTAECLCNSGRNWVVFQCEA
ncbi:hypothetical protein M427DRAFT_141440 [Gonapodya prolifera JEL478]|uniref:Carbohydrate-binding module family 19 domain-containing protein n=1 Tax=Gonapodya prolifera (strain JEL478) TaxID=1344416 RepID=A0A138ZX48_GONPJ|nr:hypothetical protein M427DRAFT_141440 [Gonapodya prolifera JEL478]|eukprot:KXS09092.1 hypothetical protein M427DRAFT_141440 [Gonapodya prolifera JEL478]